MDEKLLNKLVGCVEDLRDCVLACHDCHEDEQDCAEAIGRICEAVEEHATEMHLLDGLDDGDDPAYLRAIADHADDLADVAPRSIAFVLRGLSGYWRAIAPHCGITPAPDTDEFYDWFFGE